MFQPDFPPRRPWAALYACLCLAISGVGAATAAARPSGADPVAYSFVFFGCNRLQQADIVNVPSTANVAQLKQDFADIAKLDPAPRYVFLAGDAVTGMVAGTSVLQEQLQAWKSLIGGPDFPRLPLDTKLVVFTGNHELLYKPKGSEAEVPNAAATPGFPFGAYSLWSGAMAEYIPGNNGPAAEGHGKEAILDDESRLSYSFKDGDYLFLVLNTDTLVGNKGKTPTTTGAIPLDWIGQQLAAAERDSSIRHVFVLGHKPIKSPSHESGVPQGNVEIQKKDGHRFYELLNNPLGAKHPSTKVRAYLSAHAHEWAYKPNLHLHSGGRGSVPQIVAGNGGSEAVKSWLKKPKSGEPPNDYYGFTRVSVTPSGRIVAESFGRPIPSPYDSTAAQPAATVQAPTPVTLYSTP